MTDRPRLLCLIHLPPPVHGAAVVSQLVIESELVRSRFDVDVVPLRFSDSIADLEKPTLAKGLRALAVAARLVKTLTIHRPDSVYFTIAPRGAAFLRDCVYVALIKAFGVPRVFHMHGGGVASARLSWWRRPLYAWAFDDAWVIHLAAEVAGDTDAVSSAGRTLLVPNGVADVADIEPIAHDGPPRVLFLSNLGVDKGPLVLVDALARLHARGVAFEATFAGAPFGDCVDQLHAAIAAHDLASRVRYVGPVFDAAKLELFRNHDVFVLPTLNDAFPLAVLEAMRHELPVVATDVGALPAIVRDGETGLLVAPRDPEALADRLAVLLGDRDRRRAMGRAGRARYLARYTSDRFEQVLVGALERCMPAGAVASHGID